MGLDEFLMLGLIGVTYGLRSSSSPMGFSRYSPRDWRCSEHNARAPVAQGRDRRQEELPRRKRYEATATEKLAVDPQLAGAYMTKAVRGFNEQLERIVEVAIVRSSARC